MASSQWVVGRGRDFRGGESQSALPEMVGQNQFIRMENAMIFPNGWVNAAHQADTEVIMGADLGLAIVPYSNGTYNIFSASGDGNVYGQLLVTASGAPVNMAAGAASGVAGSRIVGVQKAVEFLGKWYCPNPNSDDTLNGILNLTDMVLINVPTGTGATNDKLRVYGNRLWSIDSNGLVHISNNGDATTWDPLNVLLLQNSEPCIDFIPVQGGAIAYGATSIYAMFGTTYLDISFVPLMLGKNFTTGSVEVSGTVYILSTEGIYAATLNGAQIIPHHQEVYFQACFGIFSDPTKAISAIYLQNSQSIIFTWPDVYGVGQALVFYLAGAYSKLNKLLPAAFPFIIALNDTNTNYLVGISAGIFAKSEYPSANMLEAQPAYLQTRNEDCGAYREKVWSEFVIVTGEVVYGVTLQAYLDYADTPITIASEVGLTAGENTFWLDCLPRSKSISMLITIDNTAVLEISTDEDPNTLLTDDTGNILVSSINPGNWTIRELRLRYREAGPEL